MVIALVLFFGGGCGLSFMGCNWLMLVGYDGGCGLILVVWLILGFGYGCRWWWIVVVVGVGYGLWWWWCAMGGGGGGLCSILFEVF